MYIYYFLLIILSLFALMLLFNVVKNKKFKLQHVLIILLLAFAWYYPSMPINVTLESVDHTKIWMRSDVLGFETYELNHDEKTEFFDLFEDNQIRKTSNKVNFGERDDVTITIQSNNETYHIYMTRDPNETVNFFDEERMYRFSDSKSLNEYFYQMLERLLASDG